MWLPRNQKNIRKKIGKKFLIWVFWQNIGLFKNLYIYIYIYPDYLCSGWKVQTNDTQKKRRKCSLKFPKSELIVHTGTPGEHSSNCGTKQKLHCRIVSAFAGRANKQFFVRIVRKVQAKESPNFSKSKNLMQIEIPRHSPCTYILPTLTLSKTWLIWWRNSWQVNANKSLIIIIIIISTI